MCVSFLFMHDCFMFHPSPISPMSMCSFWKSSRSLPEARLSLDTRKKGCLCDAPFPFPISSVLGFLPMVGQLEVVGSPLQVLKSASERSEDAPSLFDRVSHKPQPKSDKETIRNPVIAMWESLRLFCWRRTPIV